MDIKYGGIKRKIFPLSNKSISMKSTIELVKTSKISGLFLFIDFFTIIGSIVLLVYFVTIKYRTYKNLTDNPKGLNNDKLIKTTIDDLKKSIGIYSLLSLVYFTLIFLNIYKNYNNKLNLNNSKIFWLNLIFLGMSFLYSLSLLIIDIEYLRIFKNLKNEVHKKIPPIGKNYYIFLLFISLISIIFSFIGLYSDILIFHNEK